MLVLNDQNFEQEVLKSDTPVLVDFWAEWCMPCRIVTPIIDELAKEYEGRLKVGKINVDQNSQSLEKYGVMSIPSVFIFKNGTIIKSLIGAQNKETYKKEIEEALGDS